MFETHNIRQTPSLLERYLVTVKFIYVSCYVQKSWMCLYRKQVAM